MFVIRVSFIALIATFTWHSILTAPKPWLTSNSQIHKPPKLSMLTNVTNIIKQIKSLNFTGPAPNIDNIHIWWHVRYGHHDASPALWWRFWASISVTSYTYGQRSARVRTMNQTNYEMVSLPSHHLPTSSSNLSPDVMCTQLLVWCLVKPPWKSPSFHLAWASTHVTSFSYEQLS